MHYAGPAWKSCKLLLTGAAFRHSTRRAGKNWFACWSDAKLANDVPYPALPCPNSIVLLDSAGPLMLLGMAALVTAAILVGVRPGKAAKILGLCGATALTLAAVFMVVGLMMANSDGNFNGENFGHKQDHPFSPDFGMYLGIAMAVAAVRAVSAVCAAVPAGHVRRRPPAADVRCPPDGRPPAQVPQMPKRVHGRPRRPPQVHGVRLRRLMRLESAYKGRAASRVGHSGRCPP